MGSALRLREAFHSRAALGTTRWECICQAIVQSSALPVSTAFNRFAQPTWRALTGSTHAAVGALASESIRLVFVERSALPGAFKHRRVALRIATASDQRSAANGTAMRTRRMEFAAKSAGLVDLYLSLKRAVLTVNAPAAQCRSAAVGTTPLENINMAIVVVLVSTDFPTVGYARTAQPKASRIASHTSDFLTVGSYLV